MSLLILFSIIILCFFCKSLRLDKEIKLLLYIYFVYWGMGVFFSSFGFYGVKVPRNYTQFLLILHLFGFLSGVALYVSVNKSQIKLTSSSSNNDIDFEIDSIFKSWFFWILFSISFIYVLSLFQTYSTSLLYFGRSGEIRQNMEEVYGSFYKMYGNELIIQPFKILCFPLFGYAFIKKRIAVATILGLYLVMEATLSGGRFGYAYIVLAIVFMNVVIIKKNLKKYIPYFLLAVVLFFIASSYTKATRMGFTEFSLSNIIENGMNANAEQIVTYYTGPMAAFDYSLSHNYSDMIGGYQLGGLTFSPVIMMIHTFGTILGLDFEVPMESVYKLLEYNQVDVGTDYWNAFFTSVIYYYLDFGLVGVFIFPCFIGYFFVFIMKKLLSNQTIWITSIGCMFYIYMIKSEMKLEIISGKLFIIFIFYYLLGEFYSKKLIRSEKIKK